MRLRARANREPLSPLSEPFIFLHRNWQYDPDADVCWSVKIYRLESGADEWTVAATTVLSQVSRETKHLCSPAALQLVTPPPTHTFDHHSIAMLSLQGGSATYDAEGGNVVIVGGSGDEDDCYVEVWNVESEVGFSRRCACVICGGGCGRPARRSHPPF